MTFAWALCCFFGAHRVLKSKAVCLEEWRERGLRGTAEQSRKSGIPAKTVSLMNEPANNKHARKISLLFVGLMSTRKTSRSPWSTEAKSATLSSVRCKGIPLKQADK